MDTSSDLFLYFKFLRTFLSKKFTKQTKRHLGVFRLSLRSKDSFPPLGSQSSSSISTTSMGLDSSPTQSGRVPPHTLLRKLEGVGRVFPTWTRRKVSANPMVVCTLCVYFCLESGGRRDPGRLLEIPRISPSSEGGRYGRRRDRLPSLSMGPRPRLESSIFESKEQEPRVQTICRGRRRSLQYVDLSSLRVHLEGPRANPTRAL